jgi:hypothetical protein
MKRKERGFHSSGTLGPGWGYFVDSLAFARELNRVKTYTQIVEVSNPVSVASASSFPIQKNTCESSFAAIERANSRLNQGFAVTGVVGIIDSRHGVLLPNAIADLQKGERSV